MTEFTKLNLPINNESPLILVRFYDIKWCKSRAMTNPSMADYLLHHQLCYDYELDCITMENDFETGANFLEGKYGGVVEDFELSIIEIAEMSQDFWEFR